MTLFEKDEEYAAFECVQEESHERVLPNHWQRVVWPRRGAHKKYAGRNATDDVVSAVT